jgi:hypothetical protein
MLFFVSGEMIASTSSGLSSKSKMSKFSTILSFRTDFGMAAPPPCQPARDHLGDGLLVLPGDGEQ